MFPLVAVAGNIATGKSKIVSFFTEKYGFHPVYADKIGHEVLQEKGMMEELVALCGEVIVRDSGKIDRRKLGQLVFADNALLTRFNALIHPRLINKARTVIETHLANKPVIFEAAILFEAGWNRYFDNIILTTCERSEQIQRIIARDNRTKEEAEHILQHQIQPDEIAQRARWIIDTTDGPDSFSSQLQSIASELGVI